MKRLQREKEQRLLGRIMASTLGPGQNELYLILHSHCAFLWIFISSLDVSIVDELSAVMDAMMEMFCIL